MTQKMVLTSFINFAASALEMHYRDHYLTTTTPPSTPPPTRLSSSQHLDQSPQKVDFTAQYQSDIILTDELSDFLKLPRERFTTCNLIKWWGARTSQFPHLSSLA